jgi:hypothetical protein
LKLFLQLLDATTMRISHLTALTATCAFAMLAAVSASAQQPAPNAPPPPKLEKLEEGEQPAITIRQPATGSEISEKRAPGGQITEIKVKSGGSTYYLRPKPATGNSPSDDVSVPQWVIYEFDAGQPKPENKEKPQPATLEPAPKK